MGLGLRWSMGLVVCLDFNTCDIRPYPIFLTKVLQGLISQERDKDWGAKPGQVQTSKNNNQTQTDPPIFTIHLSLTLPKPATSQNPSPHNKTLLTPLNPTPTWAFEHLGNPLSPHSTKNEDKEDQRLWLMNLGTKINGGPGLKGIRVFQALLRL